MAYINVGARVSGVRPASKAALRRALKEAPASVAFDGTSALGPQFDGGVEELSEDITLSVCGPDPYTSRKWWANVARKADGSIKFS
jgi:hypothetical protein